MSMRKKSLFIGLVVYALLGAGIGPAAGGQVTVQLGILVDASLSINDTDLQFEIQGLINVLNDSTIIPRDGRLEVTVIMFGGLGNGYEARAIVPPTVVTDSTIPSIIAGLESFTRENVGGTPLGPAIDLAVQQITDSPHFSTAQFQVLNVVTDGGPWDPFADDHRGKGMQDALQARDRAVQAGIDEIDAEGLGKAFQRPEFVDFLLSFVWPQPGVLVDDADFQPGFVDLVENFANFERAFRKKMQSILSRVGLPGIPTLSEWGLITLSLLLGGLLLLTLRRRLIAQPGSH